MNRFPYSPPKPQESPKPQTAKPSRLLFYLVSLFFYVVWVLFFVAVIRFLIQVNSTAGAVQPVRLLDLVACVLGLFALLWWFPKRQVPVTITDPEKRVTLINASRSTFAQIFGGSLFLVTAYLTWSNVDTTRKNQIDDRFTKAVEQLGKSKDEEMMIRIGGIYALHQIALDSDKDGGGSYHDPVVKILAAFVREQSKKAIPLLRKLLTNGSHELVTIPADIRAALTILSMEPIIGKQINIIENPDDVIIGKRDDIIIGNPDDRTRFDLSRSDFQKVNLEGIQLPQVDFANARLNGADLIGVNLTEANLNRADLSNANLHLANLHLADLFGAKLRGSDLFYAYLSGGILTEADLSGAKLNGANLSGAHLYLADLRGTDLSGTNLRGTDLRGVDLSMAQGLMRDQLREAQMDKDTKLPPGFPKPPWKS